MKGLMKQVTQRELTVEDIQSARCLSGCVCFILIPLLIVETHCCRGSAVAVSTNTTLLFIHQQ